MKRFKNILAVYGFASGFDETLQRAIVLARQNEAHLTVVNAIDPIADERKILAERECILTRIVASIALPEAQKSHLVRHGQTANQILKVARTIQADLIVTPDISSGFYSQFLGFDTSMELLRRADCPVWIVRPGNEKNYRLITAAVNAGKNGALDCPANRRILEIGSSLAALENADFHVVYAWDYAGTERDMMASELPHGKHQELSELARLRNLDHIVGLVRHVLGDSLEFTPVPVRGNPHTAIIDYVEEQNTDLLVADGKIEGPIKTALIGNTVTHLLQQSSCSILLTRPIPTVRSDRLSEAA